MEKKEKLEKIAGGKVSGWLKEAEARVSQHDWRTKSAEVALVVLRCLRKQKLSQKDLAVRMGVSPQHLNKIVKGNENLTLETIAKLELALGVQLIAISSSRNAKPLPVPGRKFQMLPTFLNTQVRRSAKQDLKTVLGVFLETPEHQWKS